MVSIYPVSLLEFLDGSELERFMLEKQSLQAGEVLDGRVIKLFAQGEALVDFGRFRARALVQMPLAEGERLRVMVLETGEQIRFQIQNPEKNLQAETRVRPELLSRSQVFDLPRIVEVIKRIADSLPSEPSNTMPSAPSNETAVVNNPQPSRATVSELPPVSDNQSILSALANLKTMVKGLDLNGNAQAVAAKLGQLTLGSGLFWENKIVSLVLAHSGTQMDATETIDWQALVSQLQSIGQDDIKQQLAELVHKLRNSDPAEKPELNRSVSMAPQQSELEVLLDSMVGQQRQIFEEIQHKQDNQVIFAFNLPFEQAKISGKLKLYLKKGKTKKQDSAWRISLLLNLSRLGEIRTDFYYLPKLLRLTMFVLDRAAQNEILQNSTGLIEYLRHYIESVHLEVLVSKTKIDHFEDEEWLEEIDDKSLSVDIKV